MSRWWRAEEKERKETKNSVKSFLKAVKKQLKRSTDQSRHFDAATVSITPTSDMERTSFFTGIKLSGFIHV